MPYLTYPLARNEFSEYEQFTNIATFKEYFIVMLLFQLVSKTLYCFAEWFIIIMCILHAEAQIYSYTEYFLISISELTLMQPLPISECEALLSVHTLGKHLAVSYS